MLGSSELVVILIVALLIFGPSKLPQLGSAIGKSIRNFRAGVSQAEKETSVFLTDEPSKKISENSDTERS